MATKTYSALDWDSEAEVDILRHLCLTNFWFFFLYGYGALANPKGEKWIEESVHKPLADWYQKHVDEWFENRRKGLRLQKHLAVVVHREVGKSTMITQAGQSWLHLRDPEISSYTGSEKNELAEGNLNAIKAVLDGSDPYALFVPLFGNWADAARRWTGKVVTHAARKNTARRDPSFGTFGVETSIVGAHPDAIFYDDPISYERLASDTQWLDRVNSQITSLVPVIQGDGLFVAPGTRYDDGDHFGVSFRDEGIATLEGTPTDSIAPSEGGKWHVYFMAGRDSENVPTTPKVWSEVRLKDYQRRDPLRYAAQVLNDPSVSEMNPLTMEQIRQCAIPADQVPWTALRYAICCDTAFWDGKTIARKDETVYIVHGYPRDGSGDVYVIEGYGSNTWRAEDLAKHLVTICQRYRRQGRKIFAITDETTRAGKKGAWGMALHNYFADANEPFPGGSLMLFERGDTKKHVRLHAATTFWVDGHVRIIEGCPGFAPLTSQMSKVGQYKVNPNVKIDWADAHSDAFMPELYNPMRRKAPVTAAPYEQAAKLNPIQDLEDLINGEERYAGYLPREPVR